MASLREPSQEGPSPGVQFQPQAGTGAPRARLPRPLAPGSLRLTAAPSTLPASPCRHRMSPALERTCSRGPARRGPFRSPAAGLPLVVSDLRGHTSRAPPAPCRLELSRKPIARLRWLRELARPRRWPLLLCSPRGSRPCQLRLPPGPVPSCREPGRSPARWPQRLLWHLQVE